ncbi:hypothetical protein [Motilimonas pumila]|uniref:Uncharacterized protein n=1 Tax=Motilimonas pumila TaxID=2303987 RepID=A0A418YAD8_9GAMM|nr:hypothetical protein [Motilimonas pumila]RJG39512.1 hypothetical protein D1Z90_17905 [Motilimonas pumila]
MNLRLLLLLYFITPFAFAGNNWPDFSIPEDTDVEIINEKTIVNGLPMKMYRFNSVLNTQELIAFYKKEWSKPSQPDIAPYVINDVAFWKVIARFDSGFMISVQIKKTLSGSFGFISISDVESLQRRKYEGVVSIFPAPKGSKKINDFYSYDIGSKSRTVLILNKKDIRSNINFYTNHFISKGWVKDDTPNPINGDKYVLILSKGVDRLNMTISRDKKERITSIVAVHIDKDS